MGIRAEGLVLAMLLGTGSCVCHLCTRATSAAIFPAASPFQRRMPTLFLPSGTAPRLVAISMSADDASPRPKPSAQQAPDGRLNACIAALCLLFTVNQHPRTMQMLVGNRSRHAHGSTLCSSLGPATVASATWGAVGPIQFLHMPSAVSSSSPLCDSGSDGLVH